MIFDFLYIHHDFPLEVLNPCSSTAQNAHKARTLLRSGWDKLHGSSENLTQAGGDDQFRPFWPKKLLRSRGFRGSWPSGCIG